MGRVYELRDEGCLEDCEFNMGVTCQMDCPPFTLRESIAQRRCGRGLAPSTCGDLHRPDHGRGQHRDGQRRQGRSAAGPPSRLVRTASLERNHRRSLNGNPYTVSLCLETIWNYPNSTTEGYRAVGIHDEAIKQLVAAIRHLMAPPVPPKKDMGFHTIRDSAKEQTEPSKQTVSVKPPKRRSRTNA